MIFNDWLTQHTPQTIISIEPLKGDASFRRYHRIRCKDQTYIGVASPPATENNPGFIEVSQAFNNLNLKAPSVLAFDLDHGFLLLTDLGDDVFFNKVNKDNADIFYKTALDNLAKIQACPLPLAHFDHLFMNGELQNFRHWLLEKHWQLTLSAAEDTLLENTFKFLLDAATTQPQCFIHRDYHSRNLMILPNNHIGILDFQDALIGPVTYDAVSLLRDCYIDWPDTQVKTWSLYFYSLIKNNYPTMNAEQFLRYFDLMGIQRHLKAAFIFARKYHRDHVDSYLNDLPRTLGYVIAVGKKYPELNEFIRWLEEKP